MNALQPVISWVRWRRDMHRRHAKEAREKCPRVATLGKPIDQACGACDYCRGAGAKDALADELDVVAVELVIRATAAVDVGADVELAEGEG